jgi:hypothetical protein
MPRSSRGFQNYLENTSAYGVMEHQDWKPVVFRKQIQPVRTPQPAGHKREPDLETDKKVAKISHELRFSLIQARGNLSQKEMHTRCGQVGCRLDLKDIQDAESGKATQKIGKAVALAYQRALRVKIL